MLKVKKIRTVSFLGNKTMLLRQLMCPLCSMNEDCCFYYKSSMYRVVQDNPDCKVVIVSAENLLQDCNLVCSLCSNPNTILFLTHLKSAKKQGIRIDIKRLSYILKCPVVADTGCSCRGINRLLNAINIVCDANDITAGDNKNFNIVRFAVYIKCTFAQKLYNISKYIL